MKIKVSNWAIAVLSVALLSSCRESPQTYVIHSPIYPNANQDVTFTVRLVSGSATDVTLFETVSTINSSGTITAAGTESSIMTQGGSGSLTFPISHTKSGGYPANRLVTYRYEVKGNGRTYNHRITFATGPYPVANKAIPVYVVGDVNKVMNMVFVPDSDIVSMTNFYNAVSSQITNAFQAETWLNRFRNSYNFYVNPSKGRATDYDGGMPHRAPSNITQLSFAQGVCILHQTSLRDHAGSYSGVSMFSAELLSYNDVLHESGHGMYALADEYSGGSHWPSIADYKGFPLRNNWPRQDSAQVDAPKYTGKTAASVSSIQTGWWQVCNSNCVMESYGSPFNSYDEPCKQRILYKLLERATN